MAVQANARFFLLVFLRKLGQHSLPQSRGSAPYTAEESVDVGFRVLLLQIKNAFLES